MTSLPAVAGGEGAAPLLLRSSGTGASIVAWADLPPEMMAEILRHLDVTSDWMSVALTCKHYAACVSYELLFVARSWYQTQFRTSVYERQRASIVDWVPRYTSRVSFPSTFAAQALHHVGRLLRFVGSGMQDVLLSCLDRMIDSVATAYVSPLTPPFEVALFALRLFASGYSPQNSSRHDLGALLLAYGLAQAFPGTSARILVDSDSSSSSSSLSPSAAIMAFIDDLKSLNLIPTSAKRLRSLGLRLSYPRESSSSPSGSLTLSNGSKIRFVVAPPPPPPSPGFSSKSCAHTIAVSDSIRQLVFAVQFRPRSQIPPSLPMSHKRRKRLIRLGKLTHDGTPRDDLSTLVDLRFHHPVGVAESDDNALALLKAQSRVF